MGRKRRRHNENKKAEAELVAVGTEVTSKGQPYNSTPADPPYRLVTAQPGAGGTVAVAFGRRLAIATSGCATQLRIQCQHLIRLGPWPVIAER